MPLLHPAATGRAVSPLSVGLTSGETMVAKADWVSRMVCNSATGSNLARRSLSLVLVSALTALCHITHSQGVTGKL